MKKNLMFYPVVFIGMQSILLIGCRKILKYLILSVISCIIILLIFISSCKKDSGTSGNNIPAINTIVPSVISGSEAISGGNVISDGGSPVTDKGVCWRSLYQKPTISDFKTSDGSGTGPYTSTITGLVPGIGYYLRAYAINSNGISYGNQVFFFTFKLPTVSTVEVTAVNSTTIVSGGIVSKDGGSAITSRGVCWSINPIPTILDSKTSDGTGLGSFNSSITITNLDQGSTYYIRAYATNGAGTSYGSVRIFNKGYLSDDYTYDYSYFPIAVWMQPPVTTASAYKSNGINTFIGIWNPLDESQWAALKVSEMKVICYQNDYALSLGSDTMLIGYNIKEDEPDNFQQGSGLCIPPSDIINEYNTLKQNDPARKVFVCLGQGAASNSFAGTCCKAYSQYLIGCDIAAVDIYPVNNTDALTHDKLEYVAIGMQNLTGWTGGNKPCFCWIETTRMHDRSVRRPDPWEVKSEVWMAIIHGAKGFGYFCHSFLNGAVQESALLEDAEMIGAVKQINEQVTALAAVLNSPSTTDYPMVTSSNPNVPVDLMTKNYKGVNYIFAIAMRRNQTTATFTVASGTNVEVYGEGRSLTLSGGKFTDDFTPYGVHIYKITN